MGQFKAPQNAVWRVDGATRAMPFVSNNSREGVTNHGANKQCQSWIILYSDALLQEVSRVLLGASAVMANGAVYARVGTAAVAAIAASKKVPCLVCCASHKFHERCQMDSITHNEIGEAAEK